MGTLGLQSQLSAIFHCLGSPTDEDIVHLSENAQAYIHGFKWKEGGGLKRGLNCVESKAVDILEKMLQFSPLKRISIDEALRHPIFDSLPDEIRAKSKEKPCKEALLNLSFENVDLTQDTDEEEGPLRAAFLRIFQEFHPE